MLNLSHTWIQLSEEKEKQKEEKEEEEYKEKKKKKTKTATASSDLAEHGGYTPDLREKQPFRTIWFSIVLHLPFDTWKS